MDAAWPMQKVWIGGDTYFEDVLRDVSELHYSTDRC